jgi:hypothetical protein
MIFETERLEVLTLFGVDKNAAFKINGDFVSS